MTTLIQPRESPRSARLRPWVPLAALLCLISCVEAPENTSLGPARSDPPDPWISVYGHAEVGAEVDPVDTVAVPLWAHQEPLPPEHPAQSEGANFVVDALVGADGRVACFRWLTGTGAQRADEAYLQAVLTEWSFEPARSGEQAVVSRCSVAVYAPPV